MSPCLFCNTDIEFNRYDDVQNITCNLCGKYTIALDAYEDIEGKLELQAKIPNRKTKNQPSIVRLKANISSWLRENQSFKITTENWQSLFKIRTPSFHERADKLLLALQKKTEYVGHDLPLSEEWLSFGWCENRYELQEFLSFLTTTKRIQGQNHGGGFSYKIIADGWKYLEELNKINAGSQQVFVAMCFSEEMKSVYDTTISKGIESAGYKPHLVSGREHNGKIDDEIIAQIRRSRFVLADFTGHRARVYYEAGFAQGLGIEVFWTCNKDQIKDLHFDIRQYNCIVWSQDNLDDFKKRISDRIESVAGRGNYQSS